jgi:hypothetical protein
LKPQDVASEMTGRRMIVGVPREPGSGSVDKEGQCWGCRLARHLCDEHKHNLSVTFRDLRRAKVIMSFL